MADRIFHLALWALIAVFTVVFVVVVGPPLAADGWDVMGALGQGFVNPYSSGYSYDIFFSYGVLAAWVIYEGVTGKVRHGWVSLVLGFVPGVAVGLGSYLLIRAAQSKK